jgi:uncharacterized protein with GYD domain
MAMYIALINWTDQGIRNFRDTGKRFGVFQDLVSKHGGTAREAYWTIGPYDLVGLIEAPDDESATAIMLELGALGNVRTTTLRAFSQEEIQAIIDKTS